MDGVIAIAKSANPQDGTDFRFTANSLPIRNYVLQWGEKGDAEDEFRSPNGVAHDPATDLIYVADSNNNRIQKFAAGFFKLDDAVPDDDDQIPASLTFDALAPGSYTFTETVPAGWSSTAVTCSSGSWKVSLPTCTVTINLLSDDDITCTFSNKGAGTADYTIYLSVVQKP